MRDWEFTPARDQGLTPAERYRSYQREGGLFSTVARQLWWGGVSTFLRLYNRLEVRGRRHLPRDPSFVLVANHASHFDALVLGAALPLRLRHHLFPLAAGDVFFETPALAAFSALVLNALPVWRRNCGAHALEKLRQRLVEEPTVYILFPEGTRSRDGRLGKFRSGVGMLLAGTAVPVVPCHLSGTFEAFPPGKYLPRFRKVRLRLGGSRCFETAANSREGWESIAQTLEADVRTLAGPAESASCGPSTASGAA